MTKFKIKAYVIDSFEEEIEAEDEESAQEIFYNKVAEGELEPQEWITFFEGTEAFDALASLVQDAEEVTEECEDDCDCSKDSCDCCK